ncbi:murein biosynthesis integral membrane protein MurJ [Cytobacillus firmus]|uniref:murein biosynthesis integral membrane protein MurJ n=1 Tax=Cytobacillus firmus TaxID=1399 RepID=UPI003BA3A9B5
MKKIALWVMVVTVISKLFGFGRELVLSYHYGASSISDAYLVAMTIPGTIFAFFGVAIATTFIPVYSKILKESGKETADGFSNSLINVVLVIVTILVIICSIYTEEIVMAFASGFKGETLKTAIVFTRISLYAMYFSGLISIYTSYLQIKNIFIIPAITGISLSVLTIISIILSSKYNILFLPVGTLIATGSQLLLMLPFLYKTGYRYSLKTNINNQYLKNMLNLSIPVMLGVSVNQINILVDRTIASQIITGGISALNYANKINLLIQGIFIMSLVSIMYPMITKIYSENNIEKLKKVICNVINNINIMVLPATIGAMIFAEPLIRFLFGRGSFDQSDVILTSSALFYYSLGMFGFGLREVLSRAFYSMHDTKTPMINAAVGVILNIVLNIILSKYLGVAGLALATSISAIFTVMLLFWSLRKKIGSLGIKQLLISSLKILIASLIMGGIAKLIFNYLISIINQNIALIIAVTIGGLIYCIIIYFMNVNDFKRIIKSIKIKLGKGLF